MIVAQILVSKLIYLAPERIVGRYGMVFVKAEDALLEDEFRLGSSHFRSGHAIDWEQLCK